MMQPRTPPPLLADAVLAFSFGFQIYLGCCHECVRQLPGPRGDAPLGSTSCTFLCFGRVVPKILAPAVSDWCLQLPQRRFLRATHVLKSIFLTVAPKFLYS